MKIQTIIDALKKIEKETGYTYNFELYSDSSCGLRRHVTHYSYDWDRDWDFSTPDEFVKKIDEIIEESKK